MHTSMFKVHEVMSMASGCVSYSKNVNKLQRYFINKKQTKRKRVP